MASYSNFSLDIYLGRGFKEDCEMLIKQYCDQNTLRFSNFARIWKDMNFSWIFSGRPGFSDLLEFVEEVIHLGKQFLVNDNEELNYRVGGLYLLYGLYFKQPTNRHVKIRMTYSDWVAFDNLVTVLRNGNHFDALFIACKLQASKAFIHVVTERQYGVEKSYRKYFRDFGNVSNLGSQFSMNESLKKTIIRSGFLNSLELINEKYYRAKCALPGGSGIQPESSLNLANKNIAEQIKQNYETALNYTKPIEEEVVANKKEVVTKQPKIRSKNLKRKKIESVEIDDEIVNLFKKPVKRKR